MFYVKWDSENNGVLLSSDVSNKERISPPRPVFHEELNLLGFDKYWNYPESKEPLLWAIGRGYYYRGRLVARAKGGNIFNAPQIVLTEEGINLKLSPIDIDLIVAKNKLHLSKLENEALDFIFNVYKKYKKEGAIFSVAFSGGKDSQVILDLVTRIIPPDELVVIFSDTTMEISYTYESVEETKRLYKNKYPGLKFLIATPPKPAIEFWKEFGPPSRIHRWCCTVAKTAPFYKLIKNITSDSKKKNKIVVFDGVRADESNQRANYDRIAEGVKHFNLVNIEGIKHWNTVEVFMYIFVRNLFLNNSYRFGLKRVGCSICPFASPLNEYIMYKIEKNTCENYLKIIKSYTESLGFYGEKLMNYISDGKWKGRWSANGIEKKEKYPKLLENHNSLSISINKPNENIFELLKLLGDVSIKKDENKYEYTGCIRINREDIKFFTTETTHKLDIRFVDIKNNLITVNKIKKIAYKVAFCVHCGACEIECPTSALVVNPEIKVNLKMCIHCGNCINFVSDGCLRAKSILKIFGGKMMGKVKNFGRYYRFGFRQEWLIEFFKKPDFLQNNSLGPKQIESFIRWAIDANLISKNRKFTQTYNLLRKLSEKNRKMVWEFILIDLFYGSNLINWFLEEFSWGECLSKKQIISTALNEYNGSEGTINNGISALFNTFENSPLGNDLRIGILNTTGKEKFIHKSGSDDIHPFAVAYSLYKAAENIGRKDFTVSELYSSEFNGGPYKIFGISREKLEKILRGLQEDRDRILRVDLNADLDNIFLNENFSSINVLEVLLERL